jgi:hypothetical protein
MAEIPTDDSVMHPTIVFKPSLFYAWIIRLAGLIRRILLIYSMKWLCGICDIFFDDTAFIGY